jgi:hypothetical protein
MYVAVIVGAYNQHANIWANWWILNSVNNSLGEAAKSTAWPVQKRPDTMDLTELANSLRVPPGHAIDYLMRIFLGKKSVQLMSK